MNNEEKIKLRKIKEEVENVKLGTVIRMIDELIGENDEQK